VPWLSGPEGREEGVPDRLEKPSGRPRRTVLQTQVTVDVPDGDQN
jgi:hypothetical protein